MTGVFNLPNSLSFSRVLIACWIVVYGNANVPVVIASLVCVAVITDLLDGYLARIMRCQSAFGAQLDPVCDAVFVLALMYYVLQREQQSLFYLLAVVVRYAIIFLYHIDLHRCGQNNLASLWTGKWSSGLAMGYLVYYFVQLCGVHYLLIDILFVGVLSAAVLMQIISWYFYYRRYLSLFHGGHSQSVMRTAATRSDMGT